MALRRKSRPTQREYDVITDRLDRVEKALATQRQAGPNTVQRVDRFRHADPVQRELAIHHHTGGVGDDPDPDVQQGSGGGLGFYHEFNWHMLPDAPWCRAIFPGTNLIYPNGSWTPDLRDGELVTNRPDMFGFGDEAGLQLTAVEANYLFFCGVRLGQPIRAGRHRLSIMYPTGSGFIESFDINPFMVLAADTSPGDQSNGLIKVDFLQANNTSNVQIRPFYFVAYDGTPVGQVVDHITMHVISLGTLNPTYNGLTWPAQPQGVGPYGPPT